MEKRIVLASASPRRKLILSQAGLDFEVVPSLVDEERELNELVSPFEAVKAISAKKAAAVCDRVPAPCVIIAADTVVSVNGRNLGKPADASDAFAMLKLLQGREHSVYTGLAVINKTDGGMEMRSLVETTAVFMRKLSDGEIHAYIRTGEPFDKAGGYGIQDKGALLIERLEGDYNNVVGLPLVKLYLVLREFGLDMTASWNRGTEP